MSVALTLAGEIFGVALPAELVKAVRSVDVDERFMAWGREQIFARGHRPADGWYVSANVAQIFGPHGREHKAALFLRRVFPSPGEMSRWYPAPPDSIGIYCYYPARILDLLLRYGRQVWRLLLRDSTIRRMTERENEIAVWRDWLMSPGSTHGPPSSKACTARGWKTA